MVNVSHVPTNVPPVPDQLIVVSLVPEKESTHKNVTVHTDIMMMVPPTSIVHHVTTDVTDVKVKPKTVPIVPLTEPESQPVTVSTE